MILAYPFDIWDWVWERDRDYGMHLNLSFSYGRVGKHPRKNSWVIGAYRIPDEPIEELAIDLAIASCLVYKVVTLERPYRQDKDQDLW